MNIHRTLNKDIYGIWGMQSNKHPEQFIKHFKGIFKKIIAVKDCMTFGLGGSENIQQIKSIKNRMRKKQVKKYYKVVLMICGYKKI